MSYQRQRNHEAWNEICDADALWGPLAFLRPRQNQLFTRVRLLFVTSLFGGFYGMCGSLVFALLHRVGVMRTVPVLWLPLVLTATSFVCGNLTFRRAWNGRARQLARMRTWLDAKGRPFPEDGAPKSSL